MSKSGNSTRGAARTARLRSRGRSDRHPPRERMAAETGGTGTREEQSGSAFRAGLGLLCGAWPRCKAVF